ncbi:MAG: DUF2156 domain-containing protein [Deltaproteobacteria bacterium]|nr:DUF2156 domain-containing protein [Deltaproteobacteria bacterium]
MVRALHPPAAVLPELPLGWCLRPGNEALHSVALPHGKTFLHCADIDAMPTLGALCERLRNLDRRGVVLKGCSAELANDIESAGGQSVVLSHSARIDLEGYKAPHKARNLAKKGAKEVAIREVPRDASTDASAEALLAAVRGTAEPRILYAYRTLPSSAARVFAAESNATKSWVGLLTLTRYGPASWHVELLVRHPEAPQGTMEHLVVEVAELLRKEGAKALNLGDVPMVMPRDDGEQIIGWDRFGPVNRALASLAPRLGKLVAHHYDVQGLYQWKNKFEPTWEPRALAGFPTLGPRDLLEMMRATGITGLFRK